MTNTTMPIALPDTRASLNCQIHGRIKATPPTVEDVLSKLNSLVSTVGNDYNSSKDVKLNDKHRRFMHSDSMDDPTVGRNETSSNGSTCLLKRGEKVTLIRTFDESRKTTNSSHRSNLTENVSCTQEQPLDLSLPRNSESEISRKTRIVHADWVKNSTRATKPLDTEIKMAKADQNNDYRPLGINVFRYQHRFHPYSSKYGSNQARGYCTTRYSQLKKDTGRSSIIVPLKYKSCTNRFTRAGADELSLRPTIGNGHLKTYGNGFFSGPKRRLGRLRNSKKMPQTSRNQNRSLASHTQYQCSCGTILETLYHLTVHTEATGHRLRNEVPIEYQKLVRGQDVWLNYGVEHSRQILRCIRCHRSFDTLSELTMHMIRSKHYEDIYGRTKEDKYSQIQTYSSTPSRLEDKSASIELIEKTNRPSSSQSLDGQQMSESEIKGGELNRIETDINSFRELETSFEDVKTNQSTIDTKKETIEDFDGDLDTNDIADGRSDFRTAIRKFTSEDFDENESVNIIKNGASVVDTNTAEFSVSKLSKSDPILNINESTGSGFDWKTGRNFGKNEKVNFEQNSDENLSIKMEELETTIKRETPNAERNSCLMQRQSYSALTKADEQSNYCPSALDAMKNFVAKTFPSNNKANAFEKNTPENKSDNSEMERKRSFIYQKYLCGQRFTLSREYTKHSTEAFSKRQDKIGSKYTSRLRSNSLPNQCDLYPKIAKSTQSYEEESLDKSNTVQESRAEIEQNQERSKRGDSEPRYGIDDVRSNSAASSFLVSDGKKSLDEMRLKVNPENKTETIRPTDDAFNSAAIDNFKESNKDFDRIFRYMGDNTRKNYEHRINSWKFLEPLTESSLREISVDRNSHLEKANLLRISRNHHESKAIKQMIKTTPYVYLPMEYSALLTKYSSPGAAVRQKSDNGI